MAYFELNQNDKEVEQYFYHEIPLHYRFIKQKGVWVKRKNDSKVVSRVHSVNIKNTELYCLKLY